MNLFQQFDALMTPEVIDRLAAATEDESGDAKKSLTAVFYSLVAGLIRRSNASMSSSMLYDQVQRWGKHGNVSTNLEELVADKEKLASLESNGNKILSQLLPSFKSPLVQMVSGYTNSPKSAVLSYTSVMAALLVDMVDEALKNKKLSPNGLNEYIREHFPALLSDSPAGLLEVMIPSLGLQDLRNIRPDAKKESREYETIDDLPAPLEDGAYLEDGGGRGGMSTFMVIGIVLLILMLGSFGWWFMKQKEDAQKAAESATESVEETATAVPVPVDSLLQDSTAVAVDSVTSATPAVTSSFGETLNNYIKDPTAEDGRVIPMDNVSFVNGTASLDPQSMTAVDALSAAMKSDPRLQIRILGYDKAGNKALANQRAYAVKRELLNRGGDNNRIDAGGTSVTGNDGISIKILSR